MIACDVLVVGAGPAGSSAARAAAKGGAKTILIEEDKEIGKPIQCAEGIGSYLIPCMPFKIPKEQLKWKIHGITFWAEDLLIKRRGGVFSGYSIDRYAWDNWIANLAAGEGARLSLNTKLIDINFSEEYNVKEVTVLCRGKRKIIKPKILIAADGVHSDVIKLLGIGKKARDLIGTVKSFELKNVNLTYPHYDQLFFGEFAKGAYSYIFPLSKNRANIGVGTIWSKNKLDNYYENFLELPVVKRQVMKAEVVVEKGGDAPIKYQTNQWSYGNVLLVGDAANQNFKPFIEGNIPSIICGDIAGKLSVKCLKGEAILSGYKSEVYRVIGKLFKYSDAATKVIYTREGIGESQYLILLGLFSNIFSIEDIEKLSKKDKSVVRNEILKWKKSKLAKLKTKFSERLELVTLLLGRWFK